MTTSELTEITSRILTEQLGMDPAEFSTDKTWSDYGADSLDEVEIVMAFEEEFDITIDDEPAERFAKLPISEGIEWLATQIA